MTDPSTTSFFRRIRERKLVQWGLAYLAAALAITQGLAFIDTQFSLPPMLMRGVTVVLAVGFVAALIIAWYHGERGNQRVTGMEIVILTTLLLIAGSVLGVLRNGARNAPVRAGTSSKASGPDTVGFGWIAVMPLDDYSTAGESSRLSDAIHDEILTHLAQIPELNPISRTSVVALSAARLTTRQIADTLRVRNVMEGSIQRVNTRLNVNVQLIDGQTERHVWSDSRVFEISDVFRLSEDVARWVTGELLVLVPTAQVPEQHSQAAVTEAYELYLTGRAWANSRKREDLARAIQALERSVSLDSLFASAHAALAFTYGLWGQYGYGGPVASYATYGRALRLAERAIELDHRLADGYAVRAYLLSKAFSPADTVEAAFRIALQLAPSSADIRIQYAHYLAREGRHAEALKEAGHAVRLDPIAPGRDSGLGYAALAAGQPETALRSAERASVLAPDLVAPRVIKALALTLLGRPSECLDIDLGANAAIRAICLHAAQRTDAAAALIDSVRNASPAGLPSQHLASYYAWTGDAERP